MNAGDIKPGERVFRRRSDLFAEVLEVRAETVLVKPEWPHDGTPTEWQISELGLADLEQALRLEEMPMRTRPASLLPGAQNVAKPPAPPPKEMRAATLMRWYRVMDGPQGNNPGTIGPFRREAGDFCLKKGKVINSGEYDIEMLQNAGCVLKEVEAPGWYVKHQRESADKVEQLREAGVQVGDAADYKGTPLEQAAGA